MRAPAIPAGLSRAFARSALFGLLVGGVLIALQAAQAPSHSVPAARPSVGFPTWLAGPFKWLHPLLSPLDLSTLTPNRYSLLITAMACCYLAALALSRHLSLRLTLAVIVALHLVIFFGPPMLSQDVFGYIGYAHNAVAHGLNPYKFGGAAVPTDLESAFIRDFRNQASQYGPVFLGPSYAFGVLSVPAALWAFKALAAASSLGCVWLVAGCARRRGLSPVFAVVLVALNPLVLEWAVGGAHNDLPQMLLVLAGIYLALGGRERGASWPLVAATAIKPTAPLIVLVNFVVAARRRASVIVAALVAAAVICVLSLVLFGPDLAAWAKNLKAGATLANSHSFVSVGDYLVHGGPLTAPWTGQAPGPLARRGAELGFLAVFAWQLVRTWRGKDFITSAGWTVAVLLVSLTWFQPWYLVWLLPLAALGYSRKLVYAALLLSGFVFVMELPVFGL